MIDQQCATFIENYLSFPLSPFIDDTLPSGGIDANTFFKMPIPQETKQNKITLKQKDSFFIIKESGSIILGDLGLPASVVIDSKTLYLTDSGVTVMPPSIKKDGWHLLAQFLIDNYDMQERLVLINQSKADKSELFAFSQGTVVTLCGQLNLRINVRICKKIAIPLKDSGVVSTVFTNCCRLAHELSQLTLKKEQDVVLKKLEKLYKKHPVLKKFLDEGLLPIPFSDEIQVISWYLREGK